MRKILAIFVAKLALWASRLLGYGGTDFPGRLARKIYPAILSDLAANIDEEIFIVTGTNGKTTTTNMIAAMIKEEGYTYVHNAAGANMMGGIITSFIEATNLMGTRHFDYALLEADEANVPLLIKEISPRVVLITNFFADQLDRFGELDHTINLIKDAVRGQDIELVLNADDPLVSHFQNETGLHCWYYGFDQTDYDSPSSTHNREGQFCVFCGHKLRYERYHYAQLGKYYCPECGNSNPRANFIAKNLRMSPAIQFEVNDMEIYSPYQGFYNAYNILAAVSLAKLVGMRDEAVQKAIAKYEPRAGRMEIFNIDSKKTILVLVKNATGFNQTLQMLSQDPASKNLFIALNDNAADGRDISWIWDVDFAFLADKHSRPQHYICSGQRSGDMALRIKYDGLPVDHIHISASLKDGILETLSLPGETAYILSSYTALFACRNILLKLQKQYGSPLTAEQQDQSMLTSS